MQSEGFKVKVKDYMYRILANCIFYTYSPQVGLELIKDLKYRVNTGNFGHQVNWDIHFANSGNPDETALEPSHQDFHC